MISPKEIKERFNKRVENFAEKLSRKISDKLVDNYIKLENGQCVLCNLHLILEYHERSNAEGKMFFETAHKQIAEKILKDYKERGWKVTLSYMASNTKPVLRFEL